MGRYRERSRSHGPHRRSVSPPPRRRYADERSGRDRRRTDDRRSPPGPTGLLVRNISLGARPEDLRVPFERFGPVKDVYLPKNYYTGEPRGFGFVKFCNAEDAAEAKHHLNNTVIGGREIAIVFAAENRKTPQEMRTTGRVSSRNGGGSRRRSPPRSPRRRHRSYSPSPSPARRYSRDHRSPSHSRPLSRSVSPREDEAYKSSRRSTSPKRNGGSTLVKTARDSDRRSPISRDESRSPRDKVELSLDYRSSVPKADNKGISRSQSRSPPYRSGSRY